MNSLNSKMAAQLIEPDTSLKLYLAVCILCVSVWLGSISSTHKVLSSVFFYTECFKIYKGGRRDEQNQIEFLRKGMTVIDRGRQ